MSLPSLSKSTHEQNSTQTALFTQSSQPYHRSNTNPSNPHTVIPHAAQSPILMPTSSIPIKVHPQSYQNKISNGHPPKQQEHIFRIPASHTGRERVNSPGASHNGRERVNSPGVSSLQKLKTFQFVKTRNVPFKTTSQRKRPYDEGVNPTNVDGNERNPEIISGAPISKKRAPCDDVTNLEEEDFMEDIQFDDISFKELFADIDSEVTPKSPGDRPLCTPTSHRSSHPLLVTTSHNVNQSFVDISITQTHPSLSQSSSRTMQLQSHSETTNTTCISGNLTTPTQIISHSQVPHFKTPISTIRNQRTKQSSGSQISNSSILTQSPFHTSTKPSSTVHSTPTSRSSVISRPTSGTHTPVGFRTPVCRQPLALVSTPMGDLGTPNVIRTPVITKRKFPGPAGRLPSLVS